MNQEEKLLHYKEEIGNATIQLSQLKGEERSLLSRLKEEHGLKSVEEAQKRIKQRGAEKAELEEKLEEKLSQIEKDYDFD